MKNSKSKTSPQSNPKRSEVVHFVPDAHLIQVLGEQLISSEKVGVLELVKNAYDAGATQTDVWVEKVPGMSSAPLSDPSLDELDGPVITISDDGSGMTEQVIREGWLRPATRLKTSIKDRLRHESQIADERGTRVEFEQIVSAIKAENRGRIPLGEKGVGRFAAHRLGRFMSLQTKSADETAEWFLQIDWKEFETEGDKPKDLDSVPLTLVNRPPTRDYGSNDSGTVLRIWGGRKGFEWTEDTVRGIGQSIALLRSPNPDRRPGGFEVEYHAPQLSDDTFEFPAETVLAPFQLTAIVDEEGKAEIEINFIPPRSLDVVMPLEVWEENADLRRSPPSNDPNYWLPTDRSKIRRRPQCGPFTVDIKLWLRTKKWVDFPDFGEFRRLLDEFGGIGVYRDGLTILPAQLASREDWLRLSKWHIQKGARISYYQMWGSVDLDQEHTLGLIDRTSREGMLETRAFADLRELIRPLIFALARRVQEMRAREKLLRRGKRLSNSVLNKRVRTASEVLRVLSTNYDFSKDTSSLTSIIGQSENPEQTLKLLAKSFDEIRRELKELREESNALLEAAGYGIAIAVGIHEIEKVTASLYSGLQKVGRSISPLDQEAHKEIESLEDTAKSLLNELKRLAPLRVTRLEKKRAFKIRDAVLAASSGFRITWEDLGVVFHVPPKKDDFTMFGSFGACSQVFANLFDNSTYWLRSSSSEKRRLMVKLSPSNRTAVVADSGLGIAEEIRPHLFEMFYSLKNPPSGLGLYICRYYMAQMGGAIRESHERERLPGFGGAQFTLLFPEEDKDNAGGD